MIHFADNFCSFEQSKALKELGFDGECAKWFWLCEQDGETWRANKSIYINAANNQNKEERRISNPLRSQALAFFREKFGLFGAVQTAYVLFNTRPIVSWFEIVSFSNQMEKSDEVDTYAEAENALIDRLIEIAKEKTNGE